MSLVINLGNVSSHSVELSHDTMLSDSEIQKYEDYNNRINVDSRILLFSMALQFCQIVKWMSKYVDDHPDKEENLKNCVKLESDNEDRKEITEEKELILSHSLASFMDRRDWYATVHGVAWSQTRLSD